MAVNLFNFRETVRSYQLMLDELGRYPRGGYHRRYGFPSNEDTMQRKVIAP
jgi:hypothetical protein